VQQTSKEHAESGTATCPVCGSEQILGDGSEYPNEFEVTVFTRCYCCDSQWDDVYTLTGYRDLEKGSKAEE